MTQTLDSIIRDIALEAANYNAELELIDLVDNFIHSITRRHIPDYPKAKELLKDLEAWADKRVNEAKIDELNYWLGLVTWPNSYSSMQKAMKDRLATLRGKL